MNKQKGAINVAVIVEVVIAVLVVAGIIYWYANYNGSAPAGIVATSTATSTAGATSGATATNSKTSTKVVSNPSGSKTYSNFNYAYALVFPADAQNNLSNPENISFSFKSGTGAPDGVLKISVGLDVTRIAYCLTVPQGASHVTTTTINGAKFLSYTTAGSAAANTGTTYYRILHKALSKNVCYDIQKSPQGSALLNSKLNAILLSFTFI